MRQGDMLDQLFSAFVTNSGPSVVWHPAHAFGTFNASVVAGVMNLNVCALTLMSAMVCSILGMWQLTHSFPDGRVDEEGEGGSCCQTPTHAPASGTHKEAACTGTARPRKDRSRRSQ